MPTTTTSTGERLKAYRRERNLSQRQLAIRIGISNQTLNRFERGDAPSPLLAAKIDRYFAAAERPSNEDGGQA